MTLKQALETKLPFKAKHHHWWHDPVSYPGYLNIAQHKDWHGDNWEIGTFEELRNQESEMERFLYE